MDNELFHKDIHIVLDRCLRLEKELRERIEEVYLLQITLQDIEKNIGKENDEHYYLTH
jgi:hypothetical protein